VLTTASAMTQGGRKAAKGKKPAATKGRKTRTKKDEAVEIIEDVPQPTQESQKPGRGRKRASDALEDAAAIAAEAPPAKKRVARARANTVEQPVAPTEPQDTDMTDVAPSKPLPKKKGRASATKVPRKASQSSLRSQASTASLRANLVDDDDEQIDRQLQADLERPLTDEENDVDPEAEKKRAPPPTKGRSKKAATTQKSVSQQKEHSQAYAMLDPTPFEPNDAEVEADMRTLEAETASQELPTTEDLVLPKKGRKTGTRKASKQTKKAKEPMPSSDTIDQLAEDPTPAAVPPPAPAPAREPEAERTDSPEPAPVPVAKAMVPSRQSKLAVDSTEDPDASTSTIVNKTTGRPSLEKKGRGRPPKRQSGSQGTAPDPEGRRSSGIPVQIEVQIQSNRAAGTSSGSTVVSGSIPRKPVAAISPLPARSTTPTTAVTSPIAAKAHPARALPPPPQQLASSPAPPSTPRAKPTPSASAKQAALSPSPSPQSSDAENQPPSSKPAANALTKRVALVPVTATPMRGSPSKRNVVAGLQSTTPWTAVDLELIFSPGEEKENGVAKLLRKGGELTSPEKQMTVEEWIYHNAGLAEQKLKHECEAMVSTFEQEGSRAMRVLEGLVVE